MLHACPASGHSHTGLPVPNDSRDTTASNELITSALGPAPARADGAPCDPNSFDYCEPETPTAPALVCAASGAIHTCTTTASARAAACSGATVLRIDASGTQVVRGQITQPSLWNPPEGCSFTSSNQSDGLLGLVLSAPVAKRTLSSDTPYTNFDTELYALEACDSTPSVFDPRTPGAMDFWCVSDQRDEQMSIVSLKAELELKNLAAGDYLIVVDSSPSPVDAVSGDLYQLDVTAE